MSAEKNLADEIQCTASDIRKYCDGYIFAVDMKKLDKVQLARILTRLKVVEKIMLDVWETT